MSVPCFGTAVSGMWIVQAPSNAHCATCWRKNSFNLF